MDNLRITYFRFVCATFISITFLVYPILYYGRYLECLNQEQFESSLLIINFLCKGLFAQNTIRFNKNNNEIIFKKGEIIGLYLGEILTDVDLSKRYGGDRNTAPYAL